MPLAGVTAQVLAHTVSSPDDLPSEAMSTLFGRRFRKARLEMNLSQQEIERLSGIPQHYISTMERGRENPTLKTMQSLADAVGKPLPDLLK